MLTRSSTTPFTKHRAPVRLRLPRALMAALLMALTLAGMLVAAPGAVAHAAPAPRLGASLTPLTPQNASGQVTILVLDMSGSMGNPGGTGSDPDGLRCSAANAFISLSGPGQFIGVVGLTDVRPDGSVTNNQAVVWAPPTEMSTIQARNGLIDTINRDSHNCHANGDTPTYDALQKAYNMLAATATNGRAGSALLVTDGAPYPNQDQQTSDITQQVAPKYRTAGYPINTIQLNNLSGTAPFLKEVAAGTNGFYQTDFNPATGQPDPLQIAPVFLSFFAGLTGRVPKPLVTEQPINGGTQRNFSVSSLTQHLDVVIVKQDPAAQVTLISPEGIRYTAQTQSTSSFTVATDPHYAIFSIDGPTPGAWIVSIAGGGRSFSAYGLVVTALHIALTQPGGAQQAYPIDQPLAISALLTNAGVEVNGDYTVTGTLSSGAQVVQQQVLTHQQGAAIYSGSLSLPPGQAAGDYTLTLIVTQGSNDPLTSTSRTINFEIFPTPYLLDASGAQQSAVTTTVTAFPAPLQWLYGGVDRLPLLSWFSGLALSGIPATPSAVVNGVVTLHGKLYDNSQVNGSAAAAGHKAVNAPVTGTTPGHFQVIFPAAANGTYDLTLNTTGTYLDSHGAFGQAHRTVTLAIVPATTGEIVRAVIFSLLYLAILIFLAPILYRWFFPAPDGVWEMRGTGRGKNESGRLNHPHGGRGHYLRRWFRPNIVGSDELWGYPGVLFKRSLFSGSRVMPDGRDASLWKPNERPTVIGNLEYSGDGKRTFVISQSGRRGIRTNRVEARPDRSEGFGVSRRQTTERAASRSTGRDGFGRSAAPRESRDARTSGNRTTRATGGANTTANTRSNTTRSNTTRSNSGFGRPPR